ncbi:acyltransferase [Mucilaginibacter lacusdianchii]|uniref:acyltransferase n=1 Tax=Mucilaginibacter lacusdianchii TaxID=2684211 RepID=UPI00131E0206|nr:acyltransferase [Mucilaginibacter sp. JXJ CY 39]
MIKKLKYYVKNPSRLLRSNTSNTLKKSIKGENNNVIFEPGCQINQCVIEVIGDNNSIYVAANCRLNNVKFFIKGSNNTINIAEHVRVNRSADFWIEDEHCVISVAHHTSFESVHLAATEPNSKITIGSDCMFAYDIDVRTGDSHSILDATSNKRINYAKDVIFGNHIWVAAHCSILKGVNIADNSVIATRSVVTKSFDKKGVIVGGSPAVIIKENINWDRKRLYDKAQLGVPYQ